jgi:RNA ligase (TIGR02306 family)
MSRALASIQKIEKLASIANADFIEQATVLGWNCVVKKGEFKEGDWGVYFEIDSMLPDIPEFVFLRSTSGRVPAEGFVHRLKTKRMRGIISQGLMMPLSVFKDVEDLDDLCIGDDVTELLGVKKYEPPIRLPGLKAGHISHPFPNFIPKTDEIRVQSIPWILDEFEGRKVYATVKVDGTSVTFFSKDGQFGVCSRNHERKRPQPEPIWRKILVRATAKIKLLDTLRRFGLLHHWQGGVANTYWQIAEQYGIENKLCELGRNIAIQGEICGPSIQSNRLGLLDLQLFVYDIYDIDEKRYLGYNEQIAIANKLGLERVPDAGVFIFRFSTVQELLEFAKGKYLNGHKREGIVIRTICETEFRKLGRGSFKVINNEYLLATEKEE